MRWFRFSLILLLGAQVRLPTAKLKPEAIAAFDRYAAKAEAKLSAEAVREPKLRSGELKIESGLRGSQAQAPGAMIQDWIGRIFIPGATLAQVQSVLQDYANYKNFYKPKVIESKELEHHDGEYDVFLRLYEKHILTVVLNTTITFGTHAGRAASDHHLALHAHRGSEGSRQVVRRGTAGGQRFGISMALEFLLAIRAADGGVYARCEAISLSRDVPFGLGWMLNGFLESFPKESMMNTLRGTRSAIENRRAVSPARD